MSWIQIVLLSILGELIGAVGTYAWASYKQGQIVPEQFQGETYGYSSDQRVMRNFYQGCRDFSMAWPIQLIAAFFYWTVVRGVGDSLSMLKDKMSDHGEANSARRIMNVRQARYDELWNKRNQLAYGEELDYVENRELNVLAKYVGERPDTREPSMDQLHEMALSENLERVTSKMRRSARHKDSYRPGDPFSSLPYDIVDNRGRQYD